MATTPIYSWPYPVSSDYVKDGATAMGNLATAVENTVSALPVRISDMVINGSMRVAQRSTSVSINSASAAYNSLDRWRINWGGTYGTWTQSQQSNLANLPANATNSIRMDLTSGAQTVQAGQAFYLSQRMEAINCADLQKGTATAQKATLTFSVLASATGTYVATLWDQNNSSYQSKTYTISAANTWESKTITFDEDTSGKLGNSYLEVRFWMAAGTNFKASSIPSGWSTDTTRMAFGQTSLGTSAGAYFELTNVQLVAGSQAKSWVSRPINELLSACQRYYQRITYQATALDVAIGRVTSTTTANFTFPFPVTMRIAPTAIENGGTGANYQVVQAVTTTNLTAITFNAASTDVISVQFGVGSAVLTAGYAVGARMNNSAAYLGWSAEL